MVQNGEKHTHIHKRTTCSIHKSHVF